MMLEVPVLEVKIIMSEHCTVNGSNRAAVFTERLPREDMVYTKAAQDHNWQAGRVIPTGIIMYVKTLFTSVIMVKQGFTKLSL